MNQTSLLIPDMHCSACTGKVDRALAGLPGLAAWRINAVHQQVFVDHHTNCDALVIMRALEAVGFHPVLSGDDNHGADDATLLKRVGVAGLGTAQVMMVAMALYFADGAIDPAVQNLLRWVSMVFATTVVGYSAVPFFVSAITALVNRTVTMDVPVAIAIAVAFSASVTAVVSGSGEIYFDSVVMFTFLLLAARYIGARLRSQLDSGTASILPVSAQRITEHGHEQVAVTELAAGDVIWVRPGQRVPADGCVEQGSARVDQSQLTGESVAVDKPAGATVFAGSMAQNAFAVVVQQARQTRVARLNELALQARADRAPTVAAADRVARVFVPVVLVLAVVTWLGWQLYDPSRALSAALAVLVVSCPCALSLGVPAAIAAALSGLQRRGAVVRDGAVLERLASVTDALVDKTGTLTMGTPALAHVVCLADIQARRCVELAAALEQHSNHPLAAAFDSDPQLQANHIVSSREGVTGQIDGVKVSVGSAAFTGAGADAVERALTVQRCAGEVDSAAAVAWLSVASRVVAAFVFTDQLRPDARTGVRRLQNAGITTTMLSGDVEQHCARVAALLDMPFVAAATPETKLQLLDRRKADGAVVLALGDGLNDIPLLAGADVAVAMLEAPDQVRDTADVVVATTSMAVVADLVSCAKRTLVIMRQNLAWAMAYNLLAIPLAAFGMVPPWAAAAGMSLSSLAVVANATRLRDGC